MDRSLDTPAPRIGEERGFSLVEVMVVTAIMGVVVTAFLGILATTQKALVREASRSETMDQARLAFEAIDREVRSAGILCVTTAGSPAVYTLKLYSLSAYSSSDTSTRHWIQYRVTSDSQTPGSLKLERQQSTSTGSALSTATWPSGWRTLATGIVNTSTPFSVDSASQYVSSSGASRLLNVSFVLNADTSDVASSSKTIQGSIAIRNLDTTLSCIS